MIITKFLVQIGIIVGLITIFFISYVVNKKIKVEGQRQSKCESCSSHDCIFKSLENDSKKESEKYEEK